MREVSRILKVSIASISRWVRRIRPVQRRPGSPSLVQKIEGTVRDALVVDPCLSCFELCQSIKTLLNVTVCRQTVCKAIKRMGLTHKRVRKRGFSGRSEARHAELVKAFIARYVEARSDGLPMASLDESGFDHRELPTYGYALKGRPLVMKLRGVSNKKTRRYSLLMGIGEDNSYHSIMTANSVNSEVFSEFILQLPFPATTVLLLDNASIHHSRIVRESMATKGYEALFVPPYSPELNPIELLFGIAKHTYRKERMRNSRLPMIDSITHVLERVCIAPTLANCFMHVDGVAAKLDVTGI